MREAFPEACVAGYEPLAANLTNDPGDRHVLAAAIAGEARVIVTTNFATSRPRRAFLMASRRSTPMSSSRTR